MFYHTIISGLIQSCCSGLLRLGAENLNTAITSWRRSIRLNPKCHHGTWESCGLAGLTIPWGALVSGGSKCTTIAVLSLAFWRSAEALIVCSLLILLDTPLSKFQSEAKRLHPSYTRPMGLDFWWLGWLSGRPGLWAKFLNLIEVGIVLHTHASSFFWFGDLGETRLWEGDSGWLKPQFPASYGVGNHTDCSQVFWFCGTKKAFAEMLRPWFFIFFRTRLGSQELLFKPVRDLAWVPTTSLYMSNSRGRR